MLVTMAQAPAAESSIEGAAGALASCAWLRRPRLRPSPKSRGSSWAEADSVMARLTSARVNEKPFCSVVHMPDWDYRNIKHVVVRRRWP